MRKAIGKGMICIFIVMLLSIPAYAGLGEKKTVTQDVLFYRFGPDRTIESVKATIEIKNEREIENAVNKKCVELFQNDKEMREYIEDISSRDSILCGLNSSGTGFHGMARISFGTISRLLTFLSIFAIFMPFIGSVFLEGISILLEALDELRAMGYEALYPVAFAAYENDDCYTLIEPPMGGQPIEIEQKHTLIILGFMGYVSYRSIFKSGFETYSGVAIEVRIR